MDWLRYEHELLVGAGVPAERIDIAAAAVTLAYTERNIWDYPLPGAPEGLARLAATGLHLAIVSNSDGTVEQTLRDTAICQVATVPAYRSRYCWTVMRSGWPKPDPAIFFAIALKALDVPADAALYVGDKPAPSTWPGRWAAGLHPVHLDPYADCPEPADHDHVTGVGELADRLC